MYIPVHACMSTIYVHVHVAQGFVHLETELMSSAHASTRKLSCAHASKLLGVTLITVVS